MRDRIGWIGVLGCGLVVLGCEGERRTTQPGGAACIPGQSVACQCTNGATGAQVCAPGGDQFEPCQCNQGEGAVEGEGEGALEGEGEGAVEGEGEGIGEGEGEGAAEGEGEGAGLCPEADDQAQDLAFIDVEASGGSTETLCLADNADDRYHLLLPPTTDVLVELTEVAVVGGGSVVDYLSLWLYGDATLTEEVLLAGGYGETNLLAENGSAEERSLFLLIYNGTTWPPDATQNLLYTLTFTFEPHPVGEGEGEGEGLEGEGEGEGEGPEGEGEGEGLVGEGEGEGEGDSMRWESCNPAIDPRQTCGVGLDCIRLSDQILDRRGTCLVQCGPIQAGTCQSHAACRPGELCIRVDYDAVDATNVCVPICDRQFWEERGECFPGTYACAAEIRVSGETRFDCLDDFGGHQFVCLP